MHEHYDVVIVGGGVAAGTCAATLREELDWSGSVAVVCAEPYPPYTRPGLSKGVLRGEKPSSEAYVRDPDWYDEHDVALLAGDAAVSIDVLGRTVRVAGHSVGFGHLVLAPGAEPVRLPIGDAPPERVHQLRSIPDCDDLRAQLEPGTRWVLLGGGFIGAEFAASARMKGCEVELVMLEDVLWAHVFGDTVGRWVHERLAAQGVRIHAGAKVSRIAAAGADATTGGGVALHLESGEVVTGDQLLVGIGVQAATGLAAQARLDMAEGGVACDETLHAMRDGKVLEHVLVAGDIAAWQSGRAGERRRIEHWDVARGQGAHAARRIALGDEAGSYDEVPYFFSGLGDWAFLQLVGSTDGEQEVVRGSFDDAAFTVCWLDGGQRLVGAVVQGRDGEKDAARELVASGARMDPERLADADVPLADATQ